MQSESREEKRIGRLLAALHIAGLAVLVGACVVATAGSWGGADRAARSSIAAPVAGATSPGELPAVTPAHHLPRGRG